LTIEVSWYFFRNSWLVMINHVHLTW
jgi:hypothetical protein